MSRFHEDPYWTEIRQRAKCAWRDLNADDLDAMDMRRDHEVRSRCERSRARRSRWSDMREPEPPARSRQHWG